MNKFGIPWKSIVAFLGVLGGQLWARAVVNGVPVIPDTISAWAALLGGAFIAAVGVYLKGNLYTVTQAETKLAEANARAGNPPEDASPSDPAGGPYSPPWPRP